MRKSVLIITFLTLSYSLMFAQKKHQFDVGAGVSIPFATTFVQGGPSLSPGPNVYGEYRYSVNSHFNMSGQLGYKYYTYGGLFAKKRDMHLLTAKVFANADVLPSKNVNPYLGIGVGYGNSLGYRGDSDYFLLVPRIGVLICKHVRVTIEFDLAYENMNGNFNGTSRIPGSLNVAWTF